MPNIKPFQLIVLVLCIFATIIGVLVFALFSGKGGGQANAGEQVIIWGTESDRSINDTISEINGPSGNVKVINAKYIQKNADNFKQELLEALADSKGPDVVLMPLDEIYAQKSKLFIIPYDNYPERTFKDNFIEEAELYKLTDGFIALPFSVDPLVMYWNRDIFTAHNKTIPPKYWDEVIALAPELSKITSNLDVEKSAIALGEYRNINHAREILSALLFQSGSNITTTSYDDSTKTDLLNFVLNRSSNGSTVLAPGVAMLDFYTQFANPSRKEYSWNRSLPLSLNSFVAGDLAMYIGFGSEADDIHSKNPNLNFDMTTLPQPRSNILPYTYGKMLGFSILRSSKNKTGSFNAISAMTGKSYLEKYYALTQLPPVRDDLLAIVPTNAFGPVLYNGALHSRGWLDINPTKSDTIFKEMIESVLSGKNMSTESVNKAEQQFNLLLTDK